MSEFWGYERMEVPEEFCQECLADPCECSAPIQDDVEIDEEISKARVARRQVERALFVNGGLRNFLTMRRGA